MQIQLFSVFLLLYFIAPIYSKGKKLQLKEVCQEYLSCSENLVELKKFCEADGLKNTNMTEKCQSNFAPDFRQLSELTATNKDSMADCIKHTVKSHIKFRFTKEKIKFCAPFVKSSLNETMKETSCSMSLMKLQNRCQVLRQCCDPAPRCEQATEYSELGRKAAALREELNIKMAGCLQNSGKTLEEIMKSEKEEHCPRYLRCQKDLLQLRSRCSIAMDLPKGGDAYSWSPLYNELQKPIDVSDYECKIRFSKQYEDVLKRRKQAQDYLEHCVPVANVTREFREKQLPCMPEELLTHLPSEKPTEDCLTDVILQGKECLKLRNCCIQADVFVFERKKSIIYSCERNALYGVLADEYLLAVTALKSEMDSCYRQMRRVNSAA